jgi:hypothetical protein
MWNQTQRLVFMEVMHTLNRGAQKHLTHIPAPSFLPCHPSRPLAAAAAASFFFYWCGLVVILGGGGGYKVSGDPPSYPTPAFHKQAMTGRRVAPVERIKEGKDAVGEEEIYNVKETVLPPSPFLPSPPLDAP